MCSSSTDLTSLFIPTSGAGKGLFESAAVDRTQGLIDLGRGKSGASKKLKRSAIAQFAIHHGAGASQLKPIQKEFNKDLQRSRIAPAQAPQAPSAQQATPEEVQVAQARSRRRRAGFQGQRQTITTTPLGVVGGALTSRRSLLGS